MPRTLRAPRPNDKQKRQDTQRYPDGRSVPTVGDEVVTVRRGAFGTPAFIRGNVTKSRSGRMMVQPDRATGPFGADVGSRPWPLTQDWTLRGEEHPYERSEREARERLAQQQRLFEAEQLAERQRREREREGRVTVASLAKDPPKGARVEVIGFPGGPERGKLIGMHRGKTMSWAEVKLDSSPRGEAPATYPLEDVVLVN